MKKTLKITTEIVRDNAINLINIIPLDELHEVIIRPYSETRLQKQRGLYFRWVGIMADDWGNEKKELHLSLKKEFLLPILVEHDKEYRAWIETWHDLEGVDEAKAKIMYDIIMAATSVADKKRVTRVIMSEYMQAVERHSNQMGCLLPRPGEDYSG